MSDSYDMPGGGGGSGIGRTYRMAAPQRQAFDPTQLELLLQQQIAQPDGGQLLGYHMLARTRAENNQGAYMNALRESNQAQMRAAAQQEAGENARAVLAARNPGLAYNLSPIRAVISPDRLAQMEDNANIDNAGRVAEVNATAAQANQRNAEAGVLPPPGTVFDRYSLPTRPRAQGATEAMIAAAGRGGSGGQRAPRLSEITGVANLFGNREQAIATAVQAAEGRLLSQIGVTSDVNGRMVVPPGVSAEDIAGARTRARVEATAAVDRALAAARHTYAAAGYGPLLPPDTPRPTPETPPITMRQPNPPTPPNVAPNAAPNVAPVEPVRTPVTATAPAPASVLNPERARAALAGAPPGTAPHRSGYNPATGVFTFRDERGNVLGTTR